MYNLPSNIFIFRHFISNGFIKQEHPTVSYRKNKSFQTLFGHDKIWCYLFSWISAVEDDTGVEWTGSVYVLKGDDRLFTVLAEAECTCVHVQYNGDVVSLSEIG